MKIKGHHCKHILMGFKIVINIGISLSTNTGIVQRLNLGYV